MLRLRGVRPVIKPPGQEEAAACPDRLLLLAHEVEEKDGEPVALEGAWVYV